MKYSETRLLKLANSLYSKSQKVCPAYSSKFSKKTYTQHQHIALLCLKKRLKADYRELEELVTEMPRIQKALELDQIPDFSTPCKAFRRLSKLVFIVLLELTLPDNLSGTYGIDSTSFNRSHISGHYAKRCKIRIRSMKTTFLINSDKQLIVGVHTTTTRRHDTRIILPVIAKCTHHIDNLVADKGYDHNLIRDALESVGIKPVIPYREFTVLDKLANSMLEKSLYNKRVFNETVNSVVKRKYGYELVSRNWRNQQKEVYLMSILHNLHRQISTIIWIGFQQGYNGLNSKTEVAILRCQFLSVNIP